MVENINLIIKQRDAAVKFLADWCVAIDLKGGGWDEWDDHYKDVYYASRKESMPEGLRELLEDAFIAAKEDLNK